jgi:chaperonin GroES
MLKKQGKMYFPGSGAPLTEEEKLAAEERKVNNPESLPQADLDAQAALKNPKPKEERVLPVLKFVPYGDRVIVFPDETEEITAAGIHIPDTVKEKPQCGTVIVAGKEINDSAKTLQHIIALRLKLDEAFAESFSGDPVDVIDLKRGDRILFGKYAGTEITIEGHKVLIMRFNDIIGSV